MENIFKQKGGKISLNSGRRHLLVCPDMLSWKLLWGGTVKSNGRFSRERLSERFEFWPISVLPWVHQSPAITDCKSVSRI